MKSSATTVSQYIESLPAERRKIVEKIRQAILRNLPHGFIEGMQYGMIGYSVPLELYPDGYHADASQPLPFIALASQKNYIALYHMALYADKKLLAWFNAEHAKHAGTKPDMGKSCIRFKKPESIPFNLIGQLATKITVDDWILRYEAGLKM